MRLPGRGTRFAVLLLWRGMTTHVASLHTWLTEESPLCGGLDWALGTTRSVALLSMLSVMIWGENAEHFLPMSAIEPMGE